MVHPSYLCQDYPACGHYEPETGDTFCNEYAENERRASLSPMEREIEDATARIRARYEAQARHEAAQARYQAAPDDHDDERCGDGGDGMLCKDCIAEAQDQERLFREAVEAGDY